MLATLYKFMILSIILGLFLGSRLSEWNLEPFGQYFIDMQFRWNYVFSERLGVTALHVEFVKQLVHKCMLDLLNIEEYNDVKNGHFKMMTNLLLSGVKDNIKTPAR
jgi:hypothetical protein